ncbi:MAG: hypothetical protein WDZ37_06855 [Solirubrobacterales bacterium]
MSVSSIPRPVLIGLIGVVLLGVAFVATRPKSDKSSPTTAPATTTPAPAPSDSTSKETTKADATPTTPSEPTTSNVELTKLPAPVSKALDKNFVVAILFWRKQGVEDRHMQRAAATMRKYARQHPKEKIAVFDPGIGALTRWLTITGAEGLSQTPSYIVINRHGQSDVQTGFVDSKTMANAIENDLRKMRRSATTYKNYGT